MAEAVFLPPVEPRKIACIARNYRAHAAELGHDVPFPEAEPLFFLKPPTALVGHRGRVVLPGLPEGRDRVDYEGELGVVIGRRAKAVLAEDALGYVLGYTCLVDVTARQVQKAEGHFTRAKGYDTFCPAGPWIETDLDPSDLAIQTRLNGALVQDGLTRDMIHPVGRLVAHLSSVFTLEPGDLIATGTPSGVGPLHAGDHLEVTILGLGTLSVDVRQAQLPGSSRTLPTWSSS